MIPNHLLPELILRPSAYLDPGSGSILVQGLLALLLAGGLFLKAFWRKIFSKKGKKEEIDSDEQDVTDADDASKN